MTTTTFFHDVSHYEPDYHPAGPIFAKATEGTGYTDPEYTQLKARTLAGGWPFAGYHFLRTGAISAQAAHAYSVIGSTPAMLDVERATTATGGTAPTLAETAAFIDAYRALGGVLYLVYLPHWFWEDPWGAPSLRPLTDRDMSLISSSYTTYSPTGPGWVPYGGMTPAIWQFTATPVDNNAIKGTVADLAALMTGDTVATVDLSTASITAIAAAVKTVNVAPAGAKVYSLGGAVYDTAVRVIAMISTLSGIVDQLDAIAASGTSVDTAAILAQIAALRAALAAGATATAAALAP